MNLLDKGIAWFNDKRINSAQVVEDVTLITAELEKVVKASVIEPESLVSNEGLRVQSHTYYFLITTSDLGGITIKRGQQFIRRGRLYEIIIENANQRDFNDPNNDVTAIPAQLRKYNAIV